MSGITYLDPMLMPVRAPPYINDGVIVIPRLNARAVAIYEAAASADASSYCYSKAKERADRCRRALTHRGVCCTPVTALWDTADSHGISNEVDKIGRRERPRD